MRKSKISTCINCKGRRKNASRKIGLLNAIMYTFVAKEVVELLCKQIIKKNESKK
jgi:hypothetical protein